MHRILAFTLSALLLLGLCVPAMGASESADERLARVTLAVKETLNLDTEMYTEFYGDVREQELGNVWSLRWSGDGDSLNIEALEDGTIVSYWRSTEEPVMPYSYYNSSSLPKLPKLDVDAAKQAASSFLERVLDAKTERVELGEPASAARLNSSSCSFSGRILLNGLSSPLNYSITVRGSDNTVTSFRRDALAVSFLGNIPSPTPAVSRSDAAQTLRSTLEMELIYVTDENDASRAVLRYVQTGGGNQYVDAQTGKLVDPYEDYSAYGTNAAMAMDESAMESAGTAKRALTEAEFAGVEKLEGVLDSEALDKLVRGESAYKLDGYSVASANYRLVKDGETETVLCTLRYVKAEDEDGYTRSRSFTLNARTGAAQSLYSYAPWDKEAKSAVSAAEAQKLAEAFFARFSTHASEFELRDANDRTADGAPFYGFTYARKVNGVFFPEDTCTIQIDRMDGAVAGVSLTYSEDKTFDSTEGVVTAEAALDAWMETYDVALAYRSQSRKLNAAEPLEAKLIDCGYTSFRMLLLTYALERSGYFPGVDAKTGKPVELPSDSAEIAYKDIDGHWAEQEIGTLAKCGVGFAGESFCPDRAMTQWELVALLASTQGMRFDPENTPAEERDYAYETAYRLGALTREERKDDAPLTRGELVKSLLGCTSYGQAAKLTGIFTCAYADRDSIPEAEMGYAALAQALDLVRGERYDASAAVTRAVAAVMLYRMMEA